MVDILINHLICELSFDNFFKCIGKNFNTTEQVYFFSMYGVGGEYDFKVTGATIVYCDYPDPDGITDDFEYVHISGGKLEFLYFWDWNGVFSQYSLDNLITTYYNKGHITDFDEVDEA